MSVSAAIDAAIIKDIRLGHCACDVWDGQGVADSTAGEDAQVGEHGGGERRGACTPAVGCEDETEFAGLSRSVGWRSEELEE